MIKIKYTCFWPDFNQNDFFINDMIQKDYKIVTDDSYDVIIMSVFNYQNLKVKENSIKILFNGEHPSYIDRFLLITGIKLNLIIGFTTSNQIPGTMQVYYPLWILYYDKTYSQEYFDKVNNNLKNVKKQDLLNKKFCCIINSHDTNNTRIPIYANLIKYDKIDCPGKLLHNMNSIGNSSEDKIKFMGDYKFNICSENGKGFQYMTEKLPQCIDAFCIPLYYGDMGPINTKIFNKNRIINITDTNNISDEIEIIKMLLEKPEELLKFYRQPIFKDGSYKYIKQIKENARIAIEKLINSHSK